MKDELSFSFYGGGTFVNKKVDNCLNGNYRNFFDDDIATVLLSGGVVKCLDAY